MRKVVQTAIVHADGSFTLVAYRSLDDPQRPEIPPKVRHGEMAEWVGWMIEPTK